ncbi:MAG: (Fe-S)-binding protein [Myxococcota bacterium]
MSADSSNSSGGAPSLASLLDRSLYTDTLDCVHCGLCLTSCPTYRATGRETASPRGRIYLMRGLAEGRLEDTEVLEEEAFLCLGCRACESACPSGVHYGEMLENARDAIRTEQAREGRLPLAAKIERFALREIVPRAGRLSFVVSLLGIAQTLRLDRLMMKVVPARLAEMMALAPLVPAAKERRAMPPLTSAVGERKGRVALFEGCIMSEFFGRVNDATRLVLSRAGYEVIVPEAQGCCGALQAHSGDLNFAHDLARENVRAFEDELRDLDAVIVTSAGCSAALRDGEAWLGESGAKLAGGVRDILEFLDEVDLDLEFKPLAKRVCYDDPCHLIHAQGIASAPRRLLNKIPKLELVSHANPEACCGAAGIYNLTQPEMSKRVLSPKVESLAAAKPEIVATANPGCAMQIASGLEEAGVNASVVHPIELIEQATRP